MHTHTHTLTGKSLMTERMNTNSHFKSSFNTSFAQLLKRMSVWETSVKRELKEAGEEGRRKG